jgi:hypothetical protein
MSNQRNAADRVRPFLQAMEKSITAARQRRLNDRPGVPAPGPVNGPANTPTPQPAPTTPATTGPGQHPSPGQPPNPNPHEVPVGPDGRPRLRARPKRPSNATQTYDNGGYATGA